MLIHSYLFFFCELFHEDYIQNKNFFIFIKNKPARMTGIGKNEKAKYASQKMPFYARLINALVSVCACGETMFFNDFTLLFVAEMPRCHIYFTRSSDYSVLPPSCSRIIIFCISESFLPIVVIMNRLH